MAGEFASRARDGEFDPIWRELGSFGTARAREVRHRVKGTEETHLLLVERKPGLFVPLLKIVGGLGGARAAIHRGGEVLALSVDFGGNVPSVVTWAWVWTPDGPVSLRPQDALAEAVSRVLPGYRGYRTGINWRSLHMRTGVWKGEWPGKRGVHAGFEAWFNLEEGQLNLKRATYNAGGVSGRWP